MVKKSWSKFAIWGFIFSVLYVLIINLFSLGITLSLKKLSSLSEYQAGGIVFAIPLIQKIYAAFYLIVSIVIVLAIIFSLIGIKTAKKYKLRGDGLSIAGLSIALMGLLSLISSWVIRLSASSLSIV